MMNSQLPNQQFNQMSYNSMMNNNNFQQIPPLNPSQFDQNPSTLNQTPQQELNQNPSINQNIQPQEQEVIKERPIIPSKDILYFYNNIHLSDSTLKYNEIELPFHRVVLCSASNYIDNYFKQIDENNFQKETVLIPELVTKDNSKGDVKYSLDLILKYCYANQKFDAIKNELDDDNLAYLLAFSHSLQINSLIQNLEREIIKNAVKDHNVIKIAQDSILFELPELHNFAIEKIKKDYSNLKNLNVEKEILNFNFEDFKNFVSSDELDVENEKEICELIKNYILDKRQIVDDNNNNNNNNQQVSLQEPPKVENNEISEEKKNPEIENPPEEKKEEEEKKDEENPPPEEEKKDEENPPPEEEKKDEENPPPEEEKKDEEKKDEENPPPEEKNEEEKNNENPSLQQPNQINDLKEKPDLLKNWSDHLLSLRNKIKKVKLTPEQERELILCIRFSFLSHQDLMTYTNDQIIGEYKELILQGLSIRLNTYESTPENNLLICIKPRKYLNEKINNNNNNRYYQNKNNFQFNNNEFKNNDNQPYSSYQNNNNFDNRNLDYNYSNYQENYDNRMNDQPYSSLNIHNNFQTHPDVPYSSMNQNFEDQNFNSDKFKNIRPNFNNDINNNNNNNDINYNSQRISKNLPLNMDIKHKFSNTFSNRLHPPQDPKISFDFFKNAFLKKSIKPIFKYEFDFDENGVFFYLGTQGKKSLYKNPAEIGIVKVFSSSLGKGNLSDFVGRNLVNLRTENEENSFFGVDLGENRYLNPSCYSIKNRNSSSHVMLCWNLEGSNDKINYEILDTRIFNLNEYNDKLEKERNLLKQPGCTSTWGISKKIREKFPNGFRYFVLKQIDKNSNGSYNLAISGFELYGDSIGDWNYI